jgi:hypothetical protein
MGDSAMSGRPAQIRQRDLKQVINVAKKAGAKLVEVQIGPVPVIIHLSTDDKPIAEDEQITL